MWVIFQEHVVCGKYFSDAEGTHEIAANSWVTPVDSSVHHFFTEPITVTPPYVSVESR